MKNKLTMMMFGSLFMTLPLLMAADTPAPTKEQKQQEKAERQKDKLEFENASIDSRVSHAQETYQKSVDHINKRFTDLQTLESGLRDAHLSYEKQMLDDRVTFLNSLKTVKAADRKAAWEKFDSDEKAKREQFQNDQKAKRDAFHQQEEADRQQFQQAMKADNDQFREQLRSKGQPPKK